ncbi:transposase [Zobellella sp. DQSA1]|uniref:transposase n=1 Tax=Zobellella sp. DQSA1 TaxID=3342386 RepID=UPI0035BED3B3
MTNGLRSRQRGKTRHHTCNWRQCNRALVHRGSLTFWIDEQAIRRWYCHQHHGRQGRGFHYSDGATRFMNSTSWGWPA